MTKEQAAYLAGIIDGEGCITLLRQKRGHIYLRLNIANTDETLFAWIVATVPYRYCGGRRKTGPLNKPLISANWDNVAAFNILKECIPFMVIKKTRAEIAIDFFQRGLDAAKELGCADGKFRGKGRALPESLIEYREECWNKMRSLNRRGDPALVN